MNLKTYHTYSEITQQTKAWENAHNTIAENKALIKQLTCNYHQVIFTGCGSTYYLSLAGASLYQSLTGKTTRAVPASELLLNSATILNEDSQYLLIAVSRSGTTTETVKAVEKFLQGKNGKVIVVSNYDSTLAGMGDLSLIIPEGQEESVAQTRSFSSMYVAVNALCAVAADRDDLIGEMSLLMENGQRLMDRYEQFAREVGEDLNIDRIYFLGSGELYGLACEGNLKMKEMTLTHSEPFHFLEFRHGPMSMVDEHTIIVGLVSEKNREHEQKVLDEMRARNARIIAISEINGDVNLNSNLPEAIRGVLYLPVMQLMAFYRALAKGANPDRPKNLTAVVNLNL